ncbi:MAG: hypothetical protein K2W96_07370 [Gemmataceae bacterium]|nr:hypothetical protein [Gemmataceae bacterium]
MATWKVLVVLLFGIASLALIISTLIMGMSLGDRSDGWPWFAGSAGGTVVVGALFILFLRSADRGYPN